MPLFPNGLKMGYPFKTCVYCFNNTVWDEVFYNVAKIN